MPKVIKYQAKTLSLVDLERAYRLSPCNFPAFYARDGSKDGILGDVKAHFGAWGGA